jgi:hypothetical protein
VRVLGDRDCAATGRQRSSRRQQGYDDRQAGGPYYTSRHDSPLRVASRTNFEGQRRSSLSHRPRSLSIGQLGDDGERRQAARIHSVERVTGIDSPHVVRLDEQKPGAWRIR